MKSDFFLTPKQQLFCDSYLTDFNATRAALRAGYSTSTALNGQLMQMPKIKYYLQERMAETSAKFDINHNAVLAELTKIGLANMGNYFGEDGKVKPMNEISADDMAAVESIVVSPDGTVKIKLYSKMAALEKIAKHLNFYNPPEKPQAPVYVHVTTADLVADDSFDDNLFKQDVYRELQLEKKAENIRLKTEALKEEAKKEAQWKTQEFPEPGNCPDQGLPEPEFIV
jgi:hypothetical protein